MINRRQFSATNAAALCSAGTVVSAQEKKPNRPIILSTWQHGLDANREAWATLAKGGRCLDAVEAGVRVTEADPKVTSVGLGGWPDRDGNVTLDACIMDEKSECGSVAFLQNIKHPISVARLVMEKTPHVMLVGEGARQFAIEEGFTEENLLTEQAKQEWQKWKRTQAKEAPKSPAGKAQPAKSKLSKGGEENHDTIGLLALDAQGNLCGACTTSGMAWKRHGRVGDSPIIGAGLYVDSEIGAATATGVGEAVIRAVGSFLVVELMRQGHSPQKACELAVQRVIRKSANWRELQVGFIALNKQGDYGGFALQGGFEFAVHDSRGGRMMKAKHV